MKLDESKNSTIVEASKKTEEKKKEAEKTEKSPQGAVTVHRVEKKKEEHK